MSRLNQRWENKLNLTPAFHAFDTEGVDAAGRITAESIRKLRNKIKFPSGTDEFQREYILEELDELAESFEHECFGEKDEYNEFLSRLYDTGDVDKLIWIVTQDWQNT